MDILDIFNGDAFSVASLTKSINTQDHKPQRLGELGLFDEEAITTTSVAIELDHERGRYCRARLFRRHHHAPG